jgi:arabinofuranosyltransferase
MVVGLALRDHANDDAYITFRHARNLVEGNGFAFNPGDRLLSTTAPLHALVLALLTLLTRSGFEQVPRLAIALSTVSMMALCVSTLYVLDKIGQLYAGLASLFLIASQHWFYRFYPLETVMQLALEMALIAAALDRRWLLAGAVAGLAIITRADSTLLVFVVLLYAFAAERSFGPVLRLGSTCALVSLPWFALASVYYGSPLPNTLAAKSGFSWFAYVAALWPKVLRYLFFDRTFWSADQTLLSAMLTAFALVGCVISAKRRSPILILPLWGMLHLIGYTLLRVPTFSWYYAPLVLVLIVMACIGASALIEPILRKDHGKHVNLIKSVLIGSGAACFVISSLFSCLSFAATYRTAYWEGARDQAYRRVASWLEQNADRTATVALAEVGTIGYFSDRRVIDLYGLVTYELRNLPKQGSWMDAIARFDPDYVVGVGTHPPDPDLTGVDGYVAVERFLKDGESNRFEDIVIYQRRSDAAGQ